MRANVKAAFLRCLYASTWRECINIILTHSGKEMIDDTQRHIYFTSLVMNEILSRVIIG